jgi:NAD(P)-dependent dehydrogenase (short-subunit alcohol dehydrogenase family)
MQMRPRPPPRRSPAQGGQAIGIGADITDRDDCTRMVEAVVEAYGGLDIAINNAGVMDGGRDGQPAPMHLANDTYLRRTIEINVLGTMYACAAELSQMVEQGAAAPSSTWAPTRP